MKSREPWTKHELNKLKKYASKGLSYQQIANKLNRSDEAIRSQCWQKDIEVKNKKVLLFQNYDRSHKKFTVNYCFVLFYGRRTDKYYS